jgi:RecB family exonuclease
MERCPFRAYAQLRLQCRPLEAPHPGVDPRFRGRLLHAALERLWNRLRDWRTLAALDAASLERMIEHSVARALRGLLTGDTGVAMGAPLARERRRATQLIRELCRAEVQRAPFTVIACERTTELVIGAATVRLRTDRVDILDGDGSVVVIDYKTGRPRKPDFLGDRLVGAQLLLYLISAGPAAVATAAVHLTAEGVAWRGLADRPGRLPRIDSLGAPGSQTELSWPQQLERWHERLAHVAQDFLDGRAAREPARKACEHCHLHVLCRIADEHAGPGQ